MKPELLAPVGSWEILAAALDAGADAVYFGSIELNMRAQANNFAVSELKEVVDKCHEKEVRAYLTVNSIVYEDELKHLELLLKEAKNAGIDAVICWDMAVLQKAKEFGIAVHLSTQASVANFEALKFYYSLGVKRFILARELSLEQIKQMAEMIKKEKLDAEIETFVHGAMCVAVSGRCFTSQFLYGKSANRGDCIQPCRRRYKVTDIETDKELELENNFVMSAKDLCTLPFIDKLIDSGVNVFKIEGRMRSPEYVKIVVEVYKEAITACQNNLFTKELIEKLMTKLKTVYNRKFSSGFYLGVPTSDDFTDIYGSDATTTKVYTGIVQHFYSKINVAEVKIESGAISKGDSILVTGPTTGAKEFVLESMEIEHKQIEKAVQGQIVAVKFGFIARENDKIFVIKKKN